MAKSVVIVSDLSGQPSAQTYVVTVGDSAYEVDLTDDEFAEYAKAVSRFVKVGRPVGSAPSIADPSQAAGVPSTLGRRSSQEVVVIKEWGRANGWEVPSRGRLPQELVRAYEGATFRAGI